MGVSGCGKSTLGAALARALGVAFIEADELHPAANIARMSSGVALSDADRRPWLRAVAGRLAQASKGRGAVAACSALKRAYRDLIRQGAQTGVTFVWLDLDAASLRQRLASRQGHFMPASMLDSQLATLEPPAPDEDAVAVDGRLETERQLAFVLDRLGRPRALGVA